MKVIDKIKLEEIKEAQKEAERIKDLLLAGYQIAPVDIKVKDIRRGYASYTRYISIPLWAFWQGKDFFTYYIIHEVCHFINHDRGGNYGHSGKFKEIETGVLGQWGLKPIYNRAYVKQLRGGNGQLLWDKGGFHR